MQHFIAENKETAQAWLCTENLVSIDGSKTVTIPHASRYNITAGTGFTVSFMVQPGASFRIGKKDVGGWEITYASGNITFTAYNTITSLSVSAPVLSGKKSRVTAYYTVSGNIGLYINNTPESKVESGSTITGDLTNTLGIEISGTSLFGLLAIYDKAITAYEFERINNETGIVPKVLHEEIQGFWPFQERTGDKAYDQIEQFNYAKGTALTPNHGTLNGYTTTELGTNTNETTQTAKVDFYAKTVIDRTNGTGVDLVSGLPEYDKVQKLCYPADGSPNKYGRNFPDSGLSGLMLGSFGMHIHFYWNGGPKTSGSDTVDLFFAVNSGVGTMIGLRLLPEGATPTITLSLPNTSTGLSKTYSMIGQKGYCTFSFFVNRSDGSISTAFNMLNDYVFNTGAKTPTAVEIANPLFRVEIGESSRFNDTIRFVGCTLHNKVSSYRQHMKTHNNSTFKTRPGMLASWNCTNFNASGLIDDKVGANDLQFFNYTANELNPVHADYALSPLNSLR